MTPSASALRRVCSRVVLACVVLCLACGSDPLGPNGTAYLRFTGVPESGQLSVGGFASLVIYHYGPDDEIVPGSRDFLTRIPVTWTISDSDVADLDGSGYNGTVTGLTLGSVVITATSDGKRVSVRLQVVAN